MARKFELGKTVVTAAVAAKMKESKVFADFVQMSLGRYVNCDWGDTCEEDKQTNEDALRNGGRLLAVYKRKMTDEITAETIWIITEWDRSCTTVLFPEDY